MSRRPALPNLHNTRTSLTALFSSSSALFCAMEPSQPLSHQSLPHSFPCNGGWGVSSVVLSPATDHYPRPTLFCFQQLTTVKFCNSFPLITIQNAGDVYPLRRRYKKQESFTGPGFGEKPQSKSSGEKRQQKTPATTIGNAEAYLFAYSVKT